MKTLILLILGFLTATATARAISELEKQIVANAQAGRNNYIDAKLLENFDLKDCYFDENTFDCYELLYVTDKLESATPPYEIKKCIDGNGLKLCMGDRYEFYATWTKHKFPDALYINDGTLCAIYEKKLLCLSSKEQFVLSDLKDPKNLRFKNRGVCVDDQGQERCQEVMEFVGSPNQCKIVPGDVISLICRLRPLDPGNYKYYKKPSWKLLFGEAPVSLDLDKNVAATLESLSKKVPPSYAYLFRTLSIYAIKSDESAPLLLNLLAPAVLSIRSKYFEENVIPAYKTKLRTIIYPGKTKFDDSTRGEVSLAVFTLTKSFFEKSEQKNIDELILKAGDVSAGKAALTDLVNLWNKHQDLLSILNNSAKTKYLNEILALALGGATWAPY